MLIGCVVHNQLSDNAQAPCVRLGKRLTDLTEEKDRAVGWNRAELANQRF